MIRQSTGLRNFLLSGGAFRDAFNGGKLEIYSGAQPASPDDAPTGTLLCTITDASGAHTPEVRATGTITLTGTSGTITGITVGGYEILGATVAFNASLTQTAADLAAQINRFSGNKLVVATPLGAVVTLTAEPGMGTSANSKTVTTTESGGDIAGTDVNMGSAVAGVSSANGLKFNAASAGSIAKLTGQTWSGINGADGTAGWFRLVGPVADAGASDAAGAFNRLDGSVATSGGDLTLSSTALTTSATTTITGFTPTEPAQ